MNGLDVLGAEAVPPWLEPEDDAPRPWWHYVAFLGALFAIGAVYDGVRS